MKKIVSLFLAVSMLLALVSCGKELTEKTETTTALEVQTDESGSEVVKNDEEKPKDVVDADSTDVAEDGEKATANAKNSKDKKAKTAEKSTAPATQDDNSKVKNFNYKKISDDPSKWTMQQIVDCYKSGMAKEDHDGVQTDQRFQLVGDLPGKASILKKPINLAMKLGSQPYPALTGGYWNLKVSDLKKADAHREGDYIVINLYPKEQIDGPRGDEHEGTVGHVVNVVQGIDDFIGYVEDNFGLLKVKYDEDSVALKYTNAYAKNVKINTKTGKMESGTWGYVVHIYLDHCTMLGVNFENFHTAIDWKCWYPVTD